MVFRWRSFAALTSGAVIALTGCAGSEGSGSQGQATRSPSAVVPASPTAAPTPAPSDPVEAALARMSVREKVGQLFMPVVYGPAADARSDQNRKSFGVATPAEAVRRYQVGGVIYFPWADNVKSASQLARMSNDLQRQSPKIPLLIGVDQENGIVSRLDGIVTPIPGQMAQGATRRPADVADAARVTGEELRALGIRLNFAPVADVNVNPRNPVIGVRSFGSDPAAVGRLVAAAIKGYHAAGVASSAKHFPGHGDTHVDSHTGLPVIEHTRAQWERLDAPPFAAAIKNGVDVIMSAHVVMPKLDPSGDPATLSKPILTGLLRDKLGFRGVISTDALDMAGVRKKYGDAEVAVRAILAGADLLLMPPDVKAAHEAVLKAVESGRVSAARLDESVRRILRLKQSRGVLARPDTVDPERAAQAVNTEAHRAVAQRVADHAVTLVRKGPLPIQGKARFLVVGPNPEALAKPLAAQSVSLPADGTVPASLAQTAVAQAKRATAVVVLTRGSSAAQLTLVNALAKSGRPVIAISTGTPYDLPRLRSAKAALATYSTSPAAMRAAASVIRGTLTPTGRLPVRVPGLR
ncbi:glycoside hydrolase family 3 protein [Bailinhaonella thermotolerans]|uniref:beta-N-acetylhexosaminidase n=1 Tax=Bailinhaonella thermotolerans TaxID=1070861 RepID=A0A3A4BGL1_9ACTN|nr:glycoside hydrolase family 3 protein [Bailinhaonella thermotolerans]RJL30442.1 beta-hexosaminidase [Bailinhaonella thermotolerans]